MSAVAEKLRKARESVVEVKGFAFTIRRPTDVEAQRLRGIVIVDELIPFVVGWSKVNEVDVIPGGTGQALEFDPEVCREWLSDRPDLLQPLVDRIVQSYQAHREALRELEKN